MKFQLPLHKILQEQRKNNKFCDVTFRTGDGAVSAHRCVLAGATEYFDRMFSSDFRDKGEDEVDMSGVFSSATPLNTIIDCIYGVDITLSEDYIMEIVNASKLFLLDTLTDECVSFLCKNITLRNSLSFWSFANTFDFDLLSQKCSHVVTSRFHDVIKNTEEALLVPPEELVRMFKAGCGQHCGDENWNAFLRRWMRSGGTMEHEKTVEMLMIRTDKEMERNNKAQRTLRGCNGNDVLLPKTFSDLTKLKHPCTVMPMKGYIDSVRQLRKQFGNLGIEDILAHETSSEHGELLSHFRQRLLPDSETEEYLEILAAELVSGTSEEVLVCDIDDECIVYRPKTNKWLTAVKEHFDVQKLLGVGKSGMGVFITDCEAEESTLHDVKEQKKIRVPVENVESTKIYFSLQGVLFCCQYSNERSRSWADFARQYWKKLSIYIYVSSANIWKRICSKSEVFYYSKSMPFILQNNSENVFILTMPDVSLHRFNLQGGSLERISSTPLPDPPIRLGGSPRRGRSPRHGRVTSDGLVFHFFDVDLVYTLSSKTWSRKDRVSLIDSASAERKHLYSGCYMDTFGVEIVYEYDGRHNENFFHCISAYNEDENIFYKIPSPPTGSAVCRIRSQIVPSAFLDELREKTCDVDTDAPLSRVEASVDPEGYDKEDIYDPMAMDMFDYFNDDSEARYCLFANHFK